MLKNSTPDYKRTAEEVLTELLYMAMCVPEHLVTPFIALAELTANDLDMEAIQRSQEYAHYRHEQLTYIQK
jgi:hypothetical protein